MITAEEIIKLYDLQPLEPEGGYFSVTHVSDIPMEQSWLPVRYTSDKFICGTILYLITEDSFSRMHFLPTDEMYHFYLGDPVEQLQLLEDGSGKLIQLGQDILHGELVQSVVPANAWHGTRLVEGGSFALLGTTMAPAYTDGDYIDGDGSLVVRYPQFVSEILRRL